MYVDYTLITLHLPYPKPHNHTYQYLPYNYTCLYLPSTTTLTFSEKKPSDLEIEPESRHYRIPKKTTKKAAAKKKKASTTKASKKKATAQEIELMNETGRRKVDIAPPVERRKRRRQIDPTTCEREYTDAEVQFMHAMDEYKRASGCLLYTSPSPRDS